jgi:hypothetical protein
MKSFFALSIALGLTVTLAGCGGASSDDQVTDEGTAETSADLSGKVKHHYEPGVNDVTWHIGCGIVRPDDPPCQSGLTMTYTKSYVDLTFTHTEHVNNSAHRLDITVDSWSYATVHPMVMVAPQTISLDPKNLHIGTHYDVFVHDHKGNTIYTGAIDTFIAE